MLQTTTKIHLSISINKYFPKVNSEKKNRKGEKEKNTTIYIYLKSISN